MVDLPITGVRRARHWISVLAAVLVTVLVMDSAWAQVAQSAEEQDAAELDAEVAAGEEPLPLEELQVFAEVFGKIKSEYVDDASDVSLLRDAITGMLSGLDPHSTFLEPEAFKEVRISTEGKFGGIGIEVTTEDGQIKIVTPIDGTPAADADIEPGDVVTKIDGKAVRGTNIRDAIESMRGEPGTQILLTISREGRDESFEVPLVRAIIKVASVRGELLEPGLGYARISSFQSNTSNNLRDQIDRLEEANQGELEGLVLDLRNNPGGVLSAAVDVSDLFLVSGSIVATRGRDAADDTVYRARPGDILDDAPLVVLVNSGSASASEIVAGALQDHERAIIMGTRTFGKGSVQTVIPMNNGGALKLTTARYFTPDDRSIQAHGIEPDILVQQIRDNGEHPNAVVLRESDLEGHLRGEDEPDEEPSGSAGDSDSEEQSDSQQDEDDQETTRSILPERDYQLREALNLLKGMRLVNRRR